MFKRIILLIVFLFVPIFSVLAVDIGMDIIDDSVALSSSSPIASVAKIINIAGTFLSLAAFLVIIYAGFKWLMARGDEAEVELAKKTLKSGVIGLTIILSAWGISYFVMTKISDATGVSTEIPCVPDCSAKQCGDDGCGTSCGSCAAYYFCDKGLCQRERISLNYTAYAGGYIVGSIYQTVRYGESGSEVIATPSSSRYEFLNWDDDYVGSHRIDTNVQDDIYVSAHFKCIPDCLGKECGDDGCGGVCGPCSGNTRCSANICIDSCEGQTNMSDIDGNNYRLVAIGTQCWFKDNLATTRNNDGTSISYIEDGSVWAGTTSPAYSWYNNDYDNYGTVYGALYNGYAVTNNNLCPVGSHIPTDAEINLLESFIDPSVLNAYGYPIYGGRGGSLGAKLRGEVSLWSPGVDVLDTYGFRALPGGLRQYNNGSYALVGSYSFIFSSTGTWSNEYCRQITNWTGAVYRYRVSKKYGLSVRCLVD